MVTRLQRRLPQLTISHHYIEACFLSARLFPPTSVKPSATLMGDLHVPLTLVTSLLAWSVCDVLHGKESAELQKAPV